MDMLIEKIAYKMQAFSALNMACILENIYLSELKNKLHVYA